MINYRIIFYNKDFYYTSEFELWYRYHEMYFSMCYTVPGHSLLYFDIVSFLFSTSLASCKELCIFHRTFQKDFIKSTK